MECSTAWAAQSAWGTAAPASFWVALEQPGPWGRDALTESHLDPDVGASLAAAASGWGGRALLIRRPGQHADTHRTQPRHVLVAGGLAGSPWLLGGVVADPADLLALPWGALAGSSPADVGWLAPTDPALLVCTNAKRDRCCALRGRPVAHELAAEGWHVWECSHTGGHRFAPTGVVLPLGQVLARLTVDLGRQVLDAAGAGRFAIGALSEAHDRGVSHLPAPQAAAISWVRATEGDTDPRSLAAFVDADCVTVRHQDGRIWQLDVDEVRGEDLPDSCGKAPKPSATWRVRPR